ncbi:MAG: S24/S26 family peptidase [Nitrospira sp.]|nr:S24/S26 family peptidase [Nitrospira sp.]
MIVTLAPRASVRFAATALPDSCQGPALQHLMTLRVTSWSMYPALCKGDSLELGPPDPFHAGDLIVFRTPFGLMCHRLIARQGDCVLTKGDASSGLPEQVMISDVLGIVTAVTRGSTRVPTADLAALAPLPPWARVLDHLIVTCQENSRRIVRRAIRPALRHPRLGKFIASQIAYYATLTPIGISPIQTFQDAVILNASTLSPDHERQLNPPPLPPLLALRLGPIPLGCFHPQSNRLDIRPLLAGTPVESALARMAAGRQEG